MSEQQENLAATLAKVYSLDDLEAALPPSLTSKLGEGDKGVRRTMSMLIGFAPRNPNATFDRAAFNTLVAFDYEAKEPFSPKDAEEMLQVALESGLLTQEEGDKGPRYRVNPQLHAIMKRLMEDE
ncbi:MAG: hypothetical protein ABH867_04230 [Patescibacteria group bacterium]|nr:hypothetical protein [Patescibacteria group bacterium]